MTSGADDDEGELHALALELALGAAEEVRLARRDAAGAGLGVESKSTTTDLVTEIDRRTERWLAAEITRRRPGDAILGEEGGSLAGSASTDVRWVLDPIDGTVNFVLDLPQYAVSVAVEIAGEVVAGAVCNPATGETFHARRGGGAYLRVVRDGVHGPDVSLAGPRSVRMEQAVVATGFAYDAARRARQIAVVAPLLPRVADIRRLGAASLDLCFVAAGRLDGYFEAGLNLWDYAAGALVAREAGCVVSGLHGRPASSTLLVAAGERLAPDLVHALEQLGAGLVVDDDSASTARPAQQE